MIPPPRAGEAAAGWSGAGDAAGLDQWDGRPTRDLALGWGVPLVEAWATLGSTSDRALERARAGAAVGTVVVADEQTAGRGRRGTRWTSPPGTGLWMSTILDAATALPVLPLLVGVACADGIEALAGDVRVDVKWPNDLFVSGRKVGGVLVEATPRAVVVGIGINLTPPPGGFTGALDQTATALREHSASPLTRSDLAGSILKAMSRRLGGDHPFAAAIDEVRERDALFGRQVDTDRAGPGVARGIDRTGALLLERPDGSTVSVGSGSVRIRP